MRLLLIAAAWLPFGMTISGLARAEAVVLIRPEARDPVLVDAFNRLKAELNIHHFEVKVVGAELTSAPREALAEITRQEQAVAGIALVHYGSSTSVDVWLVDRATGKTSMRRLDVGTGDDAASALAIRTVDLLRASFDELTAVEAPPPETLEVDRTPVPPAVRALTHERKRPYALLIEGVVLFDGPELGVVYGPALSFERRFGRVGIGLALAAPLFGGNYATTRGAATFRQELVWLEASYAVIASEPFELGLGIGAGAHFLQAQGEPVAPLTPLSNSATSFLGSAGARARLELGSGIAATLSVRALGLVPPPGVAVLDQRARFATPLLCTSAGLVVGL